MQLINGDDDLYKILPAKRCGNSSLALLIAKTKVKTRPTKLFMVLWVHFFGVISKYPYHIVSQALGKCHNATAARTIPLTGERPQRPQSYVPFIMRVSLFFR